MRFMVIKVNNKQMYHIKETFNKLKMKFIKSSFKLRIKKKNKKL